MRKSSYKRYLNSYIPTSSLSWSSYKLAFQQKIVDYNLSSIIIQSLVDFVDNPLMMNLNESYFLYFGDFMNYESKMNFIFDQSFDQFTSYFNDINVHNYGFVLSYILNNSYSFKMNSFVKYVVDNVNFFDLLVDYLIKIDLFVLYWGPLENVYINLYSMSMNMRKFNINAVSYYIFVYYFRMLVSTKMFNIFVNYSFLDNIYNKFVLYYFEFKPMFVFRNFYNFNLYLFWIVIVINGFLRIVMYSMFWVLNNLKWIMLLSWRYLYLL